MRNKTDLVQKAVAEIEGWIKNEIYVDGQLLPSEGDISLQMEVSRATVRDAIRVLEVRGYVERIHGVGVRVNNRSIEVAMSFLADMIDRNDITSEEVLDVRRVIEVRAAELAALNATEKDIENLQECVEIMEKEKKTSVKHLSADTRFHDAMAKASGNRLLTAIVGSYKPLLHRQIEAADSNAITIEAQHHYHRSILECIKNNDTEGAKNHMKKHLDETEKNLLK